MLQNEHNDCYALCNFLHIGIKKYPYAYVNKPYYDIWINLALLLLLSDGQLVFDCQIINQFLLTLSPADPVLLEARIRIR